MYIYDYVYTCMYKYGMSTGETQFKAFARILYDLKIYIYSNIYVYVHTYMYIYIYMYTYIYTYIFIYIYIYVCIYTSKYQYIYM